MPFSLCIDIGNTKTKFGLFEEAELVHALSIKNEELDINNALFLDYVLEACIVSSVNPQAEKILNLDRYEHVVHLNHKSRLPFKLDYETPETLGKDRIAVTAAAHHLFPKQNSLIIDAGTCITYDFLTKTGVYKGGAISPGIQLRLRAMNDYTGKLPLVNWQMDQKPEMLGRSTIASMLSGVVNGLIQEMNGFISDYESRHEQLKILLTGGDSKFFEKELKNGIFADPNLVLIGLHEILQYNRD